jgi:hypothetical protein
MFELAAQTDGDDLDDLGGDDDVWVEQNNGRRTTLGIRDAGHRLMHHDSWSSRLGVSFTNSANPFGSDVFRNYVCAACCRDFNAGDIGKS